MLANERVSMLSVLFLVVAIIGTIGMVLWLASESDGEIKLSADEQSSVLDYSDTERGGEEFASREEVTGFHERVAELGDETLIQTAMDPLESNSNPDREPKAVNQEENAASSLPDEQASEAREVAIQEFRKKLEAFAESRNILTYYDEREERPEELPRLEKGEYLTEFAAAVVDQCKKLGISASAVRLENLKPLFGSIAQRKYQFNEEIMLELKKLNDGKITGERFNQTLSKETEEYDAAVAELVVRCLKTTAVSKKTEEEKRKNP